MIFIVYIFGGGFGITFLLAEHYVIAMFLFLLVIFSLQTISSQKGYGHLLKTLPTNNRLDVYSNKVLINNSKTYNLSDIYCLIDIVNLRVPKQTPIYWKSLIFYDAKNKKIGEFFFEIETQKNVCGATAESFKKVIEDLQNQKNYDYKAYLKTELEKFLSQEKKNNLQEIGVGLLVLTWISMPVIILMIILWILVPN